MKLELMCTAEVDLPMLAKLFAAMNDDEQARFFVEVAKIVETWPNGNGDSQWQYIGGHLRNCQCSTEGAREIIRGIAYGLEHSNHGVKP